ncbi:MAG TPA: hypothetical protein VK862_00625 [Afifellaceae bacterium]|nr:hypothetical protein [Afifellaceae bacterium]
MRTIIADPDGRKRFRFIGWSKTVEIDGGAKGEKSLASEDPFYLRPDIGAGGGNRDNQPEKDSEAQKDWVVVALVLVHHCQSRSP